MANFEDFRKVDAFCLLKTKLILHRLLSATSTALLAPSIALLAVCYSVVIHGHSVVILLQVEFTSGLLVVV